MSGVYIPGFKKPVACWHCALFNTVEERCPLHDDWYLSLKDEYEECPLVEVPDHGALIDRDALPETRVEWEDILDAPTIIPEDREKET